jgi:cellulose synthase/poly-beta-1,6-N-acetylglucosamine synthase-like glycosyltransferase
MGLTRRAFEITGGFSNLHPGEDPELVLKLWGKGLSTALVENWYVYHKRRMSWSKFAKQMSKFGKARIILNHDFPKYRKLVFWFPLFFSAGLILALGLLFVPLYFLGCLYLTYFMLVGISGTLKHGVKVGIYAILATIIQFVSYAQGFATAFVKINILSREPINALPELFFDAKN